MVTTKILLLKLIFSQYLTRENGIYFFSDFFKEIIKLIWMFIYDRNIASAFYTIILLCYLQRGKTQPQWVYWKKLNNESLTKLLIFILKLHYQM